MIRTFADVATADIYHGKKSKAARSLPQDLWPVIRRKLDYLNAAKDVQDLRVPPGNRLEALKGDCVGTFSIRVNDQYRITFTFTDGHADVVKCEDYH